MSTELTREECIQPFLLLHPLDSCVDPAADRTPSHVAAEGGLHPRSRDHLNNHLTESVELGPILKHKTDKADCNLETTGSRFETNIFKPTL